MFLHRKQETKGNAIRSPAENSNPFEISSQRVNTSTVFGEQFECAICDLTPNVLYRTVITHFRSSVQTADCRLALLQL